MSLCFDSFSCLFCCLTICLEENVSCLRNALCHVAWQCPADWFRAPGGLFVFLPVPQPINLSPTTWLRWTETNRLRLKNSQKLAFPSLNYVLNLNSDARDFFSPPNTSWARIKKYNVKTLSFMDLDGHWTVKRRRCFDSRSGLPEEK